MPQCYVQNLPGLQLQAFWACIACAAGTYSDENGPNACKPCSTSCPSAVGDYPIYLCRPDADMMCISPTVYDRSSCDYRGVAHQYCAVGVQSSCFAAGRYYSPYNGVYWYTKCNTCPANTFKDFAGTHACSACFTGECGIGKYQSTECTSSINRLCSTCPQGKYSDSMGPVCNDCGATCETGKYESTGCTSTTNRACTACSICQAGTYETTACTSTTNRVCTACSICQAGTYETTACSPATNRMCDGVCQAGTYSPAAASICLDCAAGTFSLTEAAYCSTCPAGTYSPVGATACLPCPSGSFSSAGATECGLCQAGTYSLPNSAECQTCPDGTYQNLQNSAACLSYTLCAEKFYFRYTGTLSKTEDRSVTEFTSDQIWEGNGCYPCKCAKGKYITGGMCNGTYSIDEFDPNSHCAACNSCPGQTYNNNEECDGSTMTDAQVAHTQSTTIRTCITMYNNV
jgi:hypothetical protein